MRLKVAAILVVAISLLLAEESHGGWGGFKKIFRGAKRVVKKGYKYARRTKLGHIAIELGKKALKKKLGLDEEITKLRKLREKDEEAYINAMSMIADEIAAESGDGEAQIMVEMLDELANMPDEEFNQFVAEQELEQIADSDELLLSDH
uniref:uncharacterized protein LOC120340133 n=1 Tax=Styela clava TaxID=7725 RepID=UPI001939EFEF|nr:uncharacterized protein LOC120340133 [Styela clava]